MLSVLKLVVIYLRQSFGARLLAFKCLIEVSQVEILGVEKRLGFFVTDWLLEMVENFKIPCFGEQAHLCAFT